MKAKKNPYQKIFIIAALMSSSFLFACNNDRDNAANNTPTDSTPIIDTNTQVHEDGTIDSTSNKGAAGTDTAARKTN